MRERRETFSFLSFLPRRERPLLAGKVKIRHRWKVKMDFPWRFVILLTGHFLCIWFKLTKRLNEKRTDLTTQTY